MRTTLTLDDDVAAKLKEELRRRGGTFKEAVNELLREGLQARRETKRLKQFQVRARAMGQRAGIHYDNIGDLLEQIEGPAHR
jgi:Arc/MetJ family transcription regulator